MRPASECRSASTNHNQAKQATEYAPAIQGTDSPVPLGLARPFDASWLECALPAGNAGHIREMGILFFPIFVLLDYKYSYSILEKTFLERNTMWWKKNRKPKVQTCLKS